MTNELLAKIVRESELYVKWKTKKMFVSQNATYFEKKNSPEKNIEKV